MRTFIAIELPEEIKTALSKLQEQLKTARADVSWVKPENIHLTLKFLGEIEEKNLAQINQALDELAQNYRPFYIRICSVGAFPSITSARVVWVGIDKGDDEVKAIATSLEEKMLRLGLPKEERRFSSHITIARVRSSLNLMKLAKGLVDLANSFGKEMLESNSFKEILESNSFSKENLEFEVKKITLFKSTLTPKGPLYESLKTAVFKTI